jgi:hypothetical protein
VTFVGFAPRLGVLAVEPAAASHDLAADVDRAVISRGDSTRTSGSDGSSSFAHRHERPAVDHPVAVEHLDVRERFEASQIARSCGSAVSSPGRISARTFCRSRSCRRHARPAGDDQEAAHVRRDRHAELLDALEPW